MSNTKNNVFFLKTSAIKVGADSILLNAPETKVLAILKQAMKDE
jgi:hypothetical protein